MAVAKPPLGAMAPLVSRCLSEGHRPFTPIVPHSGWIDVPICEAILTKDIKLIVSIDGSETSMSALTFVTEGILQGDRTAFAQVLHVYNTDKTLPVSCRKDTLSVVVESMMTSSVSAKRYKLSYINQQDTDLTVGALICNSIRELPADYICMGFKGARQPSSSERRRERADRLSSNLLHMLSTGNSCSLICFKDEDPKLLPLRSRRTVFVVSVSLNKASTKAFLDALRLSRPGDEIHVVYIKSYLEKEESDYTTEVRRKYEAFFHGLNNGEEEVFYKFHDRVTKFVLESKKRRETIPQAVVRYADSVEADFIVVGACAEERVERGKQPVGSMSLQICLLTDRNFVVANWIDVIPRVFEESVRRASTPGGSSAAPLSRLRASTMGAGAAETQSRASTPGLGVGRVRSPISRASTEVL